MTLENIKIGKDETVPTTSVGLVMNCSSSSRSYPSPTTRWLRVSCTQGATDALKIPTYKDGGTGFDNSPKLPWLSVQRFDSPTCTGLLAEWLFDDGTANDTSGNDLRYQ